MTGSTKTVGARYGSRTPERDDDPPGTRQAPEYANIARDSRSPRVSGDGAMTNTTGEAGAGTPRRVFLSYRRSDTAGYAGRLHEDLGKRLGSENIFIDVESIQPGENFEDVLKETVSSCETLLVLIGRLWMEPGLDGSRRLDDPRDYVGFEIAHALEIGKRTIPVLLDGLYTIPESKRWSCQRC
ncbi:MAG: toll/interleukin-1 receptor domain-containing protein [Thaumarchaeota archaeon]|nr:toll/interleukin-1 receptor domain-containing protein [Nitrososphaerota archaeon]